jgi:hypothetical protein
LVGRDNKPSNFAPQVKEALGDTFVVRASPGRPQTKGHVEGSFGLFSQEAPPIVFVSTEPEMIARYAVELMFTTWARAVNYRPMKSHGGKSRVERYLDHVPTDEEVRLAKAALEERMRRQELARQTLEARQDPVVRALLKCAFERNSLLDPDGNILDAIARYPLDIVADAIAIYEGKLVAGTLPKDADARYILGIARNLACKREGLKVAEALLRVRLEARDKLLGPLVDERDRLEAKDFDEQLLIPFVDHALEAKRRIDRLFWLLAASDVILDVDAKKQPTLLHLASRRIYSTPSIPYHDRMHAIRFLHAKVVPLD